MGSLLRAPRVGLGLLLLLGAVACQPKIGDSCSNAGDCSVQGERTCDITYPGGYCTEFGCTAGSCPKEATCIGFQSLLSLAPECADLQARPRLQRAACMRSCSSDSDCRGGYACVDMAQPNPWAALVIDGGSGKVCALPPPPDPAGDTAICTPSPAPSVPPLDAGAAGGSNPGSNAGQGSADASSDASAADAASSSASP